MNSVIYEIRNTIDNKRYIGSAVNHERRWKAHRKLLKDKVHHSVYLQNAWDKYGEKAFLFEVLENILDKSTLVDREQHYFDKLKPEYNILKDAGFSRIGTRHSEETKKKMSSALTGIIRSKKTRKKMSVAKKGRTPWNKGKNLSDEYKEKISKTLKGRTFSEEHIKNSANAHKGLKYQRRKRNARI